jgi:hypothetical protein
MEKMSDDMRHRRGKDPGNQGLLVGNGFHTITLAPLSFTPPDSVPGFQDLPQIRKAVLSWPSPHREMKF